MLKYFTHNFVTRRILRYCLRRVMHGYQILKRSGSLHLPGDFACEFTRQKLDISSKQFSKTIFGAGIDNAEIVCRQYLLLRFIGLNFNRALLYSIGNHSAFVHPMPFQWRNCLRKKNVKIADRANSLLWFSYTCLMFMFGVVKIVKTLLESINALFFFNKPFYGNFVYFDTLSAGNLPHQGNDGRSFDIMSWFVHWNRDYEVDTICHSVKDELSRKVNGISVVSIPSSIPPLTEISAIMCFLYWSICAVSIAAFDCIRGRWWHPLLLNQAVASTKARLQQNRYIAKEYLFHNSSWFYRPLWTYETEKRGALVSFYFYSTNCEQIKQANGYPAMHYGWQAMTWPRYLVWDSFQANFVKRAIGDQAHVIVTGPIYFHNSDMPMPAITGKQIAVFDISPLRTSRYQAICLSIEYYLPETCIAFLQDIHYVTRQTCYKMVWKRKRKIGLLAHARYCLAEDRFSTDESVIVIDPDIAAHRVIESSNAVISMPFTSTALIARELGKPSCYYDPTGMVQKDDRAAHGIEILNGRLELSRWIESLSAT